MKVQYNQIFSGSRLASAAVGLGRDDELRHSLLRREGTCSYPVELNKLAIFDILVLPDWLVRQSPLHPLGGEGRGEGGLLAALCPLPAGKCVKHLPDVLLLVDQLPSLARIYLSLLRWRGLFHGGPVVWARFWTFTRDH